MVGLLVGAVGFFALAPADGATGGPGGSGSTVTTSPGAGGTEGEAAAAGQAATPEEQVIFDLAEAYNNQDCASIVELTDRGYWVDVLGAEDNEEAAAQSACEATGAAGGLPEVELYQTWVIGTTPDGFVEVAGLNRGWEVNRFLLHQVDGALRIRSADMDGHLLDEGAAQSETEAERERPSGRPLGPPADPPSGIDAFDEIAQNCRGGSMVACDDLYWLASRGSDYELYGITCGGRRVGVFAGGHCERDFGRQIEDEEPPADDGAEEDTGGDGSDGGEDDGDSPSAEPEDPEAFVTDYFEVAAAGDCEAMWARHSDNMLQGQTREMAVDACEQAVAEGGPNAGAVYASLRVTTAEVEGDVATIIANGDVDGSHLMVTVTLVRDGDSWLVDFVE